MSSLPAHIQRKLEAHNEHWSDLPLVGGKSELPVTDGDVARLHELRDEIERALVTIPDPFEAVNYLEIIAGSQEYIALLKAPVDPWPEHVEAGLAHQGQVIAAWKQALEAERPCEIEDAA